MMFAEKAGYRPTQEVGHQAVLAVQALCRKILELVDARSLRHGVVELPMVVELIGEVAEIRWSQSRL